MPAPIRNARGRFVRPAVVTPSLPPPPGGPKTPPPPPPGGPKTPLPPPPGGSTTPPFSPPGGSGFSKKTGSIDKSIPPTPTPEELQKRLQLQQEQETLREQARLQQEQDELEERLLQEAQEWERQKAEEDEIASDIEAAYVEGDKPGPLGGASGSLSHLKPGLLDMLASPPLKPVIDPATGEAVTPEALRKALEKMSPPPAKKPRRGARVARMMKETADAEDAQERHGIQKCFLCRAKDRRCLLKGSNTKCVACPTECSFRPSQDSIEQGKRLQGGFSVLREMAEGSPAVQAATLRRAADDIARTAVRFGGVKWEGKVYDVGL